MVARMKQNARGYFYSVQHVVPFSPCLCSVYSVQRTVPALNLLSSGRLEEKSFVYFTTLVTNNPNTMRMHILLCCRHPSTKNCVVWVVCLSATHDEGKVVWRLHGP